MSEGFIPQMYCANWYLTLFSGYFPFEITARIWDVYLAEGRKTLFRISLAIMKINESKLLGKDMGEMKTTIMKYPKEAKVDELFQYAFTVYRFPKT